MQDPKREAEYVPDIVMPVYEFASAMYDVLWEAPEKMSPIEEDVRSDLGKETISKHDVSNAAASLIAHLNKLIREMDKEMEKQTAQARSRGRAEGLREAMDSMKRLKSNKMETYGKDSFRKGEAQFKARAIAAISALLGEKKDV